MSGFAATAGDGSPGAPGESGGVELGRDRLVEVILSLEELLDPPQERAGLRALDHAVVVGGGHRHDLRNPERLDLLGRGVPPLDRVGERAARHDRALTRQQPWHRGHGAEAAGVGEADVGALEVVCGELVLPCLGDQLLVVGVEAREVEPVRSLDAGHEQRALPLALDVHGDAEVDRGRLHHHRLAIRLLVVAAHHRPLLGGLHDRPSDQVGEAHLHAALLEDLVERLALGVERVDRELPERGGRRDRAALVHRAGEGGGCSAERLRLAFDGGGRGPVTLRREHVRLGDSAAGAGALDPRQVDAVGPGCAPRHRGRPGTVGLLAIRRTVLGATDLTIRGCFAGGACGRFNLLGCFALRQLRHRLADLDGLVGADEDLGDRARGRSRHLGVHLVGGDLDHGLTLLDLVALGDVPLEHGPLGDRLTHLRHHDLEAAALQSLPGRH
jgi:hypothetical protein